MNNIDFKAIRNQFESMIRFFDESKISNQKIFSVVFDLEFEFQSILDTISTECNPIFFSNKHFSAFNLLKEHNISFFKQEEFEIKKDKITNLLSNSVFINNNQNLDDILKFDITTLEIADVDPITKGPYLIDTLN